MLLFRWRGVPVVANSLFVLLAMLWLGTQLVSRGPAGLIDGVAGVILLFGSVLAHEFGHALVAQRFGIRVRQITLNVFGGATQFERAGLSPQIDLWVSLGGPVASLSLAAMFTGGALLSGWTLLWLLAGVNGVLGAFNLVPAFPLDGGRVLRAILEMRLGMVRGTLLALRVGAVFAWALVAAGLLLRNPGLALVAVLLLYMQRQERVRLGLGGAWR